MNRNENETESFAGNLAASKEQRLFFEVPLSTRGNARPAPSLVIARIIVAGNLRLTEKTFSMGVHKVSGRPS